MHKDIRKLVKALEADGYVVVLSTKQHAMVYSKDGSRWLTTLPGTPSDWRSMLNALRPVLRDGFQWPPKR